MTFPNDDTIETLVKVAKMASFMQIDRYRIKELLKMVQWIVTKAEEEPWTTKQLRGRVRTLLSKDCNKLAVEIWQQSDNLLDEQELAPLLWGRLKYRAKVIDSGEITQFPSEFETHNEGIRDDMMLESGPSSSMLQAIPMATSSRANQATWDVNMDADFAEPGDFEAKIQKILREQKEFENAKK